MKEATIEKTQKDGYQTDIRLKQTDRCLKFACVIFMGTEIFIENWYG